MTQKKPEPTSAREPATENNAQDTGSSAASAHSGLGDLLRRNQVAIAVFAACVFALLWLGAELTISRLENEKAKRGAEPDNPFATPVAQAVPASPRGPRTFSAERREAMLRILYEDASDKRVWLVEQSGDVEAGAYADALAGIFRDAGFEVVVTPWANGLLKPGVRMFVGPEQAPPAVELVERALEAGGVAVQQFLGYRSYRAERRQAQPNVPGVDLAEGQDFVIVVGRAE